MKRAILIGVLGWVFFLSVLYSKWDTLGLPRPIPVGPKIAVFPQKQDLGDQVFGTIVKTSFAIRNVGDAPLTVTTPRWPDVIEGCCPSMPELGKDTLQPGEMTTLSVEVSMQKGMGGKHLFQIEVNSNDAQQPRFILELASNWVADK